MEIVSVTSHDENAPSLALARQLGLPASTNYRELLASAEADLIIGNYEPMFPGRRSRGGIVVDSNICYESPSDVIRITDIWLRLRGTSVHLA